jgi:hypothetical protein
MNILVNFKLLCIVKLMIFIIKCNLIIENILLLKEEMIEILNVYLNQNKFLIFYSQLF